MEIAEELHAQGNMVLTQPKLFFIEENTARIEREKEAEIMVVIGNPPYNAWQKNENDNNKNRKYPIVDRRIRETYVKDSQATLNNSLYDPYVRFFRWASDRLGNHDGIVCFISNNSFVDQIAFDGTRKHLLQDFDCIYHLDMHGNIRRNPKLSGTTHNIFGIQIGVGITLAIKSSQSSTKKALYYYRVPELWDKSKKLSFLADKRNTFEVKWSELSPDEHHYWITEGLHSEFGDFLNVGSKSANRSDIANTHTIFKRYSRGVITDRDTHVYSFDVDTLCNRAETFIDIYNSTVDKYKRSERKIEMLSLINISDGRIKWTRQVKASLGKMQYSEFNVNHVRKCLYRPCTKKLLYFDDFWNEERYKQHLFFPTPDSEQENIAIIISDRGYRSSFSTLAANKIVDLHLAASTDAFQCFPYYTYAKDDSNRCENITDWALEQFQARYCEDVSKWDIFHYIYAMLHHPQYRERYAENLKRDLPHIPLLTRVEAYQAAVSIGRALMDLHVNYEQQDPYPLVSHEDGSVPYSQLTYVEKMKLTPDHNAVVVNRGLTLAEVPEACFRYRLGNRSALEWVIDQYQVSKDARSGIVSDPNNPDDLEYIVRLVKQVVTVSAKTVELVDKLALEVTQEDWLGETIGDDVEA